MQRQLIRDLGNCAVFNSSASAIADTISNINSNLSFTVRFQASRSSNTRTIFSNVVSSSSRIGLVLLSTGYLSFGFYNGTSYTFKVSSDRPLDDGGWYFVSGTFDGITMKLYVNGVEQSGTSQPILQATAKFSVGCDSNGSAPLRGNMDELAIYNTILTLNQQLNSRNGIFGDSIALFKFEDSLLDDKGLVSLVGSNITYTANTSSITRSIASGRTLETGSRVKVSDEGTAIRITNPDDTSYVNIAISPVISQNKSFSMQCEFKIMGMPASGDGRVFIKLHGSVAGNRSGSIQYNNTRIYATVVKGDGSVTYDTPSAVGARWMLGKWYDVVATFDITTGILSLYINGVFVTSITGDTTTPTGSALAAIGSERNTGTPRTAPVVVNKCRAWEDVVLTAKEISAMYFNKRMPPYRNNLKLELLANEGAGTNMVDSSGNGHDGTLVGSNVSFVTDVPCIERTKVT
jgi:hypothetical protein